MSLADSVGTQGLLFLLWGGLVMTAFNVVMLLVRVRGPMPAASGPSPSVLAAIRPVPNHARAPTLAPPEREFESGRIAGKRVRAATVDGALDGFAAAGLGDPRILRSVPGYKLVRVAGCRSCGGTAGRGCEFERAFLSSALETLMQRPVRSREVACGRRDGSARCEFEVTY